MTEPTTIINKRIALATEWKYEKGRSVSIIRRGIIMGEQGREWLSPQKYWQEHPPDFCGEWEHAGPLLEEMVIAGVVHLLKIDDSEKFLCGFSIRNPKDFKVTRENYKGRITTEAIARAYDAWMQDSHAKS